MVTQIKNNQSRSTTNLRRYFARVLPAQRQPTATRVAMVSLRARYYDTETGEFGSQDPLEYVDGMSQYRGYFVPNAMDPEGQVEVVPKSGDLKKKGCGGKIRSFKYTWAFKVAEQVVPGWLVQKVNVRARKADCKKIDFELPILGKCNLCSCDYENAPPVVFSYFEAWKVKANREYPSFPEGSKFSNVKPDLGTDRASFEKSSEFVKNSCGSYIQRGEIKFFTEAQVNGEIAEPGWSNDPKKNHFGPEPWTTTSRNLWSKSGMSIPGFWNGPAISTGERMFSVRWKCCECDPIKRQKIWANAIPKKEN